MNNTGKKVLALASMLALCAGVLTGGGLAGCSASHNAEPAQTEQAEQKVIEGTLYSFDGSQAVVYYDGAQYPLDLSKATVKSSSLNVGNLVDVTYEGKLDTKNASSCKVISIEVKEDSADSHELVGTLEDISMNSVTVRTLEGNKVTFNSNNAQHSFAYGLDKGNWTTVIYTGEVEGSDASKASVVRIHDMDTDLVKETKAKTTVQDANDTAYALEDVTVRDSYMMASNPVGSIKGKLKVKVTGHCNNGWDRIVFDGKEAYVYSSYLTTQANESASNDNKVVSQRVQLKEVNENVYAKTDATLREGYSTSAKVVGALKAGSPIVRTGICDNGWSRVSYNGGVAFVYSELLTTENPTTETKGVKVTAVDETVYVVCDVANVRESWSADSKALGQLSYGTKVKRTGICDNGWSRIIFNNKDAYINSDLISKTDPKKTETVTVYKVSGRAWATVDCEVRESHTADSKSLGKLTKGSEVEITGVTDNNWSRVNFNGKVGYINNDMLTSQNPNPAQATTSEKKTETKSEEKKDEKKDEKSADKKNESSKTDQKKDEQKQTDQKQTEQKQTTDQGTQTGEGQDKKQHETTPTDNLDMQDQAPDQQPTDEDPIDEGTQTDEGTDEGTTDEGTQTDEGTDEGTTDEGTTDEGTDEGTQTDEGTDEGTQTDEGTADEGTEEGTSEEGTETGEGTDEGTDTGEMQTENPDQEPTDEVIEEEPVETHDIEGIVVGYSINSITIQSGTSGDELTFYTFDISNASQEYTKGVDEGLAVKVTYTGDLSDMEGVHATKVTDSGVSQPKEVTYRGTIVSSTENTVTIQLSSDVKSTFNFEGTGVEKDSLVEGAKVIITADMQDAKLEDNVFKATSIKFVD